MADLLKKGDMGKFPDDDWREILNANGFHPSGATEEVWRSPRSGVKVKIDVDRDTEEPYYQVVTEDGTRSAKWTDAETLKSIVEPKEEEPPQLSPEEAKRKDDEFLRSVGIGIVGRWRTAKKLVGKPPRFSFTVPTKAAGPVAFHLAKAGMKDFDVTHYEEDEFSVFQFPTEPEMHVAEEIVKAEFADQIRARKGLWAMWAETHDPRQVKGERELHPSKYVASVEQESAWAARSQGKFAGQWGDRSYDSDQVHDILDSHRPKGDEGEGFDEPVPDSELQTLLDELDMEPTGADDDQHYLGVIVFLVTHGSPVPPIYRERARQIAFALVQDEGYLNEWQNPKLRRIELENEIELLEGGSKTAEEKPVEITDEDLPEGFFSDKSFEQQRREKGEPPWEPHRQFPGLRPTAATRADTYRRKKLAAWIEELGLDPKGQVYDEVRDMIKEERKFQSAYRRKP